MTAALTKQRKPEPAPTTKPKPKPKAKPSTKETAAKGRELDKASERPQGKKLPPHKKARVETASKPNAAATLDQQKAAAPAVTGRPPVEQAERFSKQERMLTLLSRPEGASIEEMMQATNWQQHSVRGFVAGTVKKKLGFSLSSAKTADGVRRYHIQGAPRPLR